MARSRSPPAGSTTPRAPAGSTTSPARPRTRSPPRWASRGRPRSGWCRSRSPSGWSGSGWTTRSPAASTSPGAHRPLRPRPRRGGAERSRRRRRHHRARRGRRRRDRALAALRAADRHGGRHRPHAQGGDRPPAADPLPAALRRLADRQHRPRRLGRLLQRDLLDGRGRRGAALPDAAAGVRRLAGGAGADARPDPDPLDAGARRRRRRRLRRHRRDGRRGAALRRPLPDRATSSPPSGPPAPSARSAAGSSTATAGSCAAAPAPAPPAPRSPTATAPR